jgi:glycine cleavage system regulatory protein
VEALSQTLSEHEANWEESRMASLAGKFAGILQATVPSSRADSLLAALRALERNGLHLHAERCGQPEREGRQHLVLELLGQDRPGIVRDISRVLASLGVNVEELTSLCEHASMAGGDLFRARAVLSLPEALDPEELRHSLESIADELMVDISLEDQALA